MTRKKFEYMEYCVDMARAWMQGAAFMLIAIAMVLLVLCIIEKVTLYAVGIVLVVETIAAICGWTYMEILYLKLEENRKDIID